tara:strand:- start:144 stop:689 length:546 start_codon:yes stop_codon:yes gene_type:complete
MTYIPLLEKASGKAGEILGAVEKDLGMIPNVFKGLANSPESLEAYLVFMKSMATSKITAQLKESLAITVASTNTCGYCASAHTALGQGTGLDEEELKLNLEAKSKDPKNQVALQFAKKIVENKGRVLDSDLEALEEAGFGSQELVEIMAIISINIFTNYFNHVAGTEIDFPLVKLNSVAVS